MLERTNIQNIIEEWKSLYSLEEKATFLKEVEKEFLQKSPEEFLENVKAVYSAIQKLYVDIFTEKPRNSII